MYCSQHQCVYNKHTNKKIVKNCVRHSRPRCIRATQTAESLSHISWCTELQQVTDGYKIYKQIHMAVSSNNTKHNDSS